MKMDRAGRTAGPEMTVLSFHLAPIRSRKKTLCRVGFKEEKSDLHGTFTGKMCMKCDKKFNDSKLLTGDVRFVL